MWKSIKKIVLVIIACAVLVGAGVLLGSLLDQPSQVQISDQAENDGPDLTLPDEVEKMVVTVDDVEAKIHEIGELTTCEGDYTVTKAADFTRYMMGNVPIPGTTNHVGMSCKGIVKAGYNMEDISIVVQEDSQKIVIVLPEPQIHSNQLLWDDSMISRDNNNILNPIDFEEYRTLLTDIKAEGEQMAIDQGLFDMVEQNAKTLIKNFLGCFVDYEVVFV